MKLLARYLQLAYERLAEPEASEASQYCFFFRFKLSDTKKQLKSQQHQIFKVLPLNE